MAASTPVISTITRSSERVNPFNLERNCGNNVDPELGESLLGGGGGVEIFYFLKFGLIIIYFYTRFYNLAVTIRIFIMVQVNTKNVKATQAIITYESF
jgi:hypothetical protein